MEDKTLSPEEAKLVNEGIAAERLLSDETFQSAINALSEQIASSIVSTRLDESANRERLYMMHSALLELINILKGRVSSKISIEDRINSQD